jgi:DNA-binding winged helix-turn-helix (wHTH) protein/TolB-like protein
VVFRFGTFEFDDQSGELRKNGRVVALEPQPAKALSRLLSNPGAVVTRDELRDAVWGGETHVDFERGLAYCLSQIRAAFGDSAENPRFVQTLPKRGYKFLAPVISSSSSSGSGSSGSRGSRRWLFALIGAPVALVAVGWVASRRAFDSGTIVVAVSIFDNETGLPEHDRLIGGLSDLVVARLTELDPARLAVVGNAAVLRQPRNIRDLKAVAEGVKADYVLLGQLQRGEDGRLRFITHVIRLRDEAHLKANRLYMPNGGVAGLEGAVVSEFERAVLNHVLPEARP